MIGAKNFCFSSEPKTVFLWRLQTVLSNSFPELSCLSCQISLHSFPQSFGLNQVILVLSLLLGKETGVQMSVTEWLLFSAAYLLSISVSLFPLPFQSCLSWTPGQWERWVTAPGFGTHVQAVSQPRWPLTFLLPLQQICSFFLFTLCRVWSNEVLSAISFLSPFCCSNAGYL